MEGKFEGEKRLMEREEKKREEKGTEKEGRKGDEGIEIRKDGRVYRRQER